MRTIRFIRTLALALALTALAATFARAAITRTFLTAAIDASVVTFEIDSATDVDAGDLLWVDDEAMRAVRKSGDIVTVRRGDHGTLAASHLKDAIVHIGEGQDFDTWHEPVMSSPTVFSGGIRSTTKVRERATVTTLTTAGAETYTAAQLLGGLILRDPNGAARTDTTPTAALLIAALPRAGVGDAFDVTIRNTADAAETLTIAGGTGATISGTATIAQNNSKAFRCRIDSATAYTCYSLGTVVH